MGTVEVLHVQPLMAAISSELKGLFDSYTTRMVMVVVFFHVCS